MQLNPTFINKKMLEIRRRKKKHSQLTWAPVFPKKKWSPNILRHGRWRALAVHGPQRRLDGDLHLRQGPAQRRLAARQWFCWRKKIRTDLIRSDHRELSEPSSESISMCLSFYGFQCVYLSKYLHNASYLYIFVHSIIHLFAHSGLQSTLPPI